MTQPPAPVPSVPSAPTTPPGPPARRRRGFETVGDMLRSLGVVLAAVAVILLITLRPHPSAVQVVDPAQARQAVTAVAPFRAQEPHGLPPGWRLTSARFQPPAVSATGASVWHLGWVTPKKGFAAVEQGDGTATVLVRSVAGEGAGPAGEGSGAWAGWQVWRGSPSGWRFYVRSLPDSTVVVYGSASDAELGRLAASLQSDGPQASAAAPSIG